MIQELLCTLICSIAAYTDHKTGYIEEELTNMGIFLGIVLLFISQSWPIAMLNIFIASAIFIIGFMLFITGQLGGGDVKLFTVIALLLPYESQLLPPVIPVFIYSGFFCIIGVFVSMLPSILKIKKINKLDALFSLTFFSSSAFVLYILSSVIPLAKVIVFAIIFLISSIMLFFRSELKNSFVSFVGVKEIEEEDVLVVDLMPKDLVKKYKLTALVSKSDLKTLESMKEMKKFPVYKNLPRFGPYVLLAIIFYLLFPNFLFG